MASIRLRGTALRPHLPFPCSRRERAGAVLIGMLPEHARVGTLGDSARLRKIRQIMPDLADAIFHAREIHPLLADIEIFRGMLARLAQQEPAARGHAVAALGQAPAFFRAVVAGGAEIQVDPAALDQVNLILERQVLAVAEPRRDTKT